MSVELVTKYAAQTDELFASESKTALVTNTDYDFSGAHSVRIWKIGTAPLSDYTRHFSDDDGDDEASLSRFGKIVDLDAATEEMILSKDRSFIFNIDKLDQDETASQLAEASALAREVREVVIPERDRYIFGKMVDGAGTTADATTFTKDTIYPSILAGSAVLDEAEVPEDGRVLILTPLTYNLLKQATPFDNTDIGADLRLKGVIGILDGMTVIKVPSNRVPDGFGYMIAHPVATTAPVKLEDYSVHTDTVLSSGTIVTGRICYDAFVLDNKKSAIYYQPVSAE